MTRLRILLGSLLALALVLPAASAPLAAAETPPLPACRYLDQTTRYTELGSWRITLLDTILKVGRTYAPDDLVPVAKAGLAGGGLVRKVALADLRRMASAAREAGKAIAVQSAYRSYATQASTFAYWVSVVGREEALRVSARAGHSEHQLGTALDFRSASSSKAPWDYEDWATTGPGTWMKRNGWKHGFVLSYPKGEASTSCYSYEPWHWRYVGRDLAAAIHASGEVPRAYLWEHYETR